MGSFNGMMTILVRILDQGQGHPEGELALVGVGSQDLLLAVRPPYHTL